MPVLSKLKREQSFVEKWLLAHEEFTNQFMLEWFHRRPELLKPKPTPNCEVSSFCPRSAVNREVGKVLKPLTSTSHLYKRKDAKELRRLNKADLFMELLQDVVSPDFDVNHLSHKILVNAILLTNADKSSLFLVEGTDDNPVLVSRLFDVTENSTVEEAVHEEHEAITIPVGMGIVGQAAQTGQIINIKNAYEDPRFNQGIDKMTGYKTTSILCVPVKAPDGEVIGVAQVINKKEEDGVFTQEDEGIFVKYLTFCAIGLINAGLFEQSLWQSKRLEVLLGLARGLFEDTTCMQTMIEKIMVEAKELIPCEVCRVLLVDDNPPGACAQIEFNKGFEMGRAVGNATNEMIPITVEELPDLEILTRVAMTGQPVNLCERALEAAFSKADRSGRSFLCMPIFDKNGQSIGVAQLINNSWLPFNQSDMESFEVFSTFCGLGILNVMTFEKIEKANAKQAVALEVLSYHAAAPDEEVDRLWLKNPPSPSSINLHSYVFDDLLLTDDSTVLVSVKMFLDSGFVDRFRINQKVLLRWILTVKKNYRPVTYHNWRHAFNVAQTMFTMFTTVRVTNQLTDLERLALLMAAFCHDLDHRGTNNTFQERTESPLAQLYSTSTMEHHHFDQCIMILNSESNNILQGLTSEEYSVVIQMLENAILSTDLALYFRKKETFDHLVFERNFDWNTESHRDLLRGMLMTACDVSAITKPWEIQKRVAELVTSEFFEQGDRQKKDELPKMQVGFIDFVCAPLYQALASFDVGFEPLMMGVLANRENWECKAKEQTKATAEGAKAEVKAETEGQDKASSKLSLRSCSTSDTSPGPIKQTGEALTSSKEITTAENSETESASELGEENEEEPGEPLSARLSSKSAGATKKRSRKKRLFKLIKKLFKRGNRSRAAYA